MTYTRQANKPMHTVVWCSVRACQGFHRWITKALVGSNWPGDQEMAEERMRLRQQEEEWRKAEAQEKKLSEQVQAGSFGHKNEL